MKNQFISSMLPLLFVFIFIFLMIAGTGQSRTINPKRSLLLSESERVVTNADKVENGSVKSNTCEAIYGLLPCSHTVVGNLFLILGYGYLMSMATKYLSDGSEVLLRILGPGVVGGLILPGLSTLPDATIVLVSGLLSASKESAQIHVSVGMGLVAGSTIMALTILWGSCVVAGKCDLDDNNIANDSHDTRIFSLTGSGISTHLWTRDAARIMLISVIPFAIVQIPQPFCTDDQSRVAILIALIFSTLFLISYFVYQVFWRDIQMKRLKYATHKHVMAGILNHYTKTYGVLRMQDGSPDEKMLEMMFTEVDLNKDNSLSREELKSMITLINLEEIKFDADDIVANIMKEFDITIDSKVDLKEFKKGMSNWLNKTKPSMKNYSHTKSMQQQSTSALLKRTKLEHSLLGDYGEVELSANYKWNIFKSVLILVAGILIAVAFAHPFVESINNFSTATDIPSFFVAFVVLPLVRYSEAHSAFKFAKGKTKTTASLTLSQIYAAITMNHNLCLSVFLGLVYMRHLTWDFSAEVWIILVVSLIVGVSASVRTTFPLWTCLVAYALYPFSPALVYILQRYVFKSL